MSSEPTFSNDVSEDDLLLSMANTQALIYKAAQQIMARDKTDGIRVVAWMDAHSQLFYKMLDQTQTYIGMDMNRAEELRQIANKR